MTSAESRRQVLHYSAHKLGEWEWHWEKRVPWVYLQMEPWSRGAPLGKLKAGVASLGSRGCWWICHDTPISPQGFLSQLQACGQFSCIQLLSQRPARSCLPAWFCQGTLLYGSAVAALYWTPQNQQAPCRSSHPLLLPLLPAGNFFKSTILKQIIKIHRAGSSFIEKQTLIISPFPAIHILR